MQLQWNPEFGWQARFLSPALEVQVAGVLGVFLKRVVARVRVLDQPSMVLL
jgi:hypothetical protein